jgi:hypothetical protein
MRRVMAVVTSWMCRMAMIDLDYMSCFTLIRIDSIFVAFAITFQSIHSTLIKLSPLWAIL